MKKLHDYRTLFVAVSTTLIIACFFLPWIKVHFTTAAAVNSLLGGKNSAAMLTTSGAGVPALASGPSSKIFIKVFGLFFKSVENADKKSYLIWAVVVLPIAVSILSWVFRGKWMVSAILGVLCAAIGIGGIVKLLLTNLDALVVRVQICGALWITLAAFLLMGLLHLLSIPVERKSR